MDTIEIAMPDGTAEAYVARPAGGGEHPGVLFCIDIIGLRPRIAEMAQRIADWGYVVLAPNVLYRSSTAAETSPDGPLTDPGAREAFTGGAMQRLQELTPERVRADLPVYLAALRDLEGVGDGPVGVTGYCAGARLALVAAGLDAGIAAYGGWHGAGLATESDDSPHLGLGNARAEFVFGHADQDRSNDADAIARLGRALDDAGLTASNEVFAGAPHGYSMSDTSAYDEAATERHFAELESLFVRAL